MTIKGFMVAAALAAGVISIGAGCRNNDTQDGATPTTQPSNNGASATATSTQTETQASAGAVNKNCAVMQDHPIDKDVTYSHGGKTYGFCCEDCIDTFKKDPAKYSNAK